MSAAAEEQAVFGMNQIQPALGTGDGHIGKAAFLLHIGRVIHAAHAGEKPLLHADCKDGVEFQTLGGMHRHEGDMLLSRLLVRIGVERILLKEALEGRFSAFAHVVNDIRTQFLYVFQPSRTLIALQDEHFLVAAPLSA